MVKTSLGIGESDLQVEQPHARVGRRSPDSYSAVEMATVMFVTHQHPIGPGISLLTISQVSTGNQCSLLCSPYVNGTPDPGIVAFIRMVSC